MPRKKITKKTTRRTSTKSNVVIDDKKILLLFLAVVGSILLLIVVLIRTPKPDNLPGGSTNGIENATISPIKGKPMTFTGTLPCADCSGIETTLVLYIENENDTQGDFRMSETYMGRSEEPLLSKGTFVKKTGSASDPEAVIYALTDENSSTQYFLMTSDTQLEMLDQNMERITGGLNYTLTLQE